MILATELSVGSIVDLALTLLVMIGISAFICLKLQRFWVIVGYVVIDVLFTASVMLQKFGLGFDYLPWISLILFACFSLICVETNAGVLRKYLAMSLKANAPSTVSKDYDKEALIQKVVEAVMWLSNNKTGALITFARTTPLDDYMKNGTIIDCPFTAEIVETIFWEGSRLHDGAIIVKDNTIVAAAVYYEPSTKVLVGKVGARHRAALGISEKTDSITIVVSEETGRIAVAHAGMIDNIKTNEFASFFRNQIL